MGEAGWHVALSEIVRGERDADPPAESRRAAADIHRDVEHLALDDADQFALCVPDLQMEAAKRAGHRSRVVVLHERALDAVLAVAVDVIGLEEEPAPVHVHIRFDHENVRKFGRDESHGQASRSSTRNR